MWLLAYLGSHPLSCGQYWSGSIKKSKDYQKSWVFHLQRLRMEPGAECVGWSLRKGCRVGGLSSFRWCGSWGGGAQGGSERPGPRRHLLTGSIQGSKEEPMRDQETVHKDSGTDQNTLQ